MNQIRYLISQEAVLRAHSHAVTEWEWALKTLISLSLSLSLSVFANTSSNGRQRQYMKGRNNISPLLPASAVFVRLCLLILEKWIECLID